MYILEHIDIEINHRCNLKCLHCSARAGGEGNYVELSNHEIKTILKNAKDQGLKKVGLTGGEPLIDIAKLEDIVQFCKEDLDVSLHAHFNGTLIKEEYCKPNGIISKFDGGISVTMLGGSAAIHDTITNERGSYNASLEGIALLVKYKLPLTVYFIPTKGTCKSYKEAINILHDMGVNKIRAMALAPSGRARAIYEQTVPNKEEMDQFQLDLLEAKDKYGIYIEAGYCTRLTMPKLHILNGHEKCMSGRNRVHINSLGDVFPCTASSGVEEFKLGNLKLNNYDLIDTWTNSILVNTIRSVHETDNNICGSCPVDVRCSQGCMVNSCARMNPKEYNKCPVMKNRYVQ